MGDAVYTAYVAGNSEVLNYILRLYVMPGADVLDATYNTGKFWKVIGFPCTLWTNDIDDRYGEYHYDLRATEFPDGFFDVVILDPPYAVRAQGALKASGEILGADKYGTRTAFVHNRDSVQLYLDGGREAFRILAPGGVLILKVQDEVVDHKQSFKHARLLDLEGFVCEDLFVVVQKGKPPMDPKWKRQYHARKNHSYFIVHRKRK